MSLGLIARTSAAALALTLALVLTVAAGCGGDDGGDDGSGAKVDSADFIGNYEVTSHRENRSGGSPVECSNAGLEIEAGDPDYAPYFAIAIDDYFDDPDLLVFQPCVGPGAGCTSKHSLETAVNGLESTDVNTQEGDDSCNLYAGRSVLTLVGGIATLEHRRWAAFDHPADDCTLEAAEALIETPECQLVAVWIGTRLE